MSRFHLPAPLPSLPAAFSRRAALFGAVVSTGALAGSAGRAMTMPAPVVDLASTDATLIGLCAELPELDATLTALFSRSPDFRDDGQIDAVGTRWSAVVDGIERTPSRGSDGLAAKARVVRHLAAQPESEVLTAISASLAADVLRLMGEAA